MDTSDNLAIRDLLARASYCLDVRDMDTLETCFHPDAIMELQIAGVPDEMRFSGRDEIMGLMRQAEAEQTDVRRHVTTNVMFAPGGTSQRAGTTANLTLTAVENGLIRLITSGYYKDEHTCNNGVWTIIKRRIELDLPY